MSALADQLPPLAAPHAGAPAPRRRWIFAATFILLGIFVTVINREAFFVTALYEEGDNAANALQIHRAKSFRELHGNYSRWGFHHPGPAFFYVYALSERWLHDATRLCPAPNNAHVFAGTLLQLAFFAGAIALLANRARNPWLVAALAIALGGFHYARVDRVLFSIWPPDVLVMPFLCFIVAAAAVSTGQRTALPMMVLAGSFLVHGHVAQPLFVIPLTLVALGLAWRRNWRHELRTLGRDWPGRTTLTLLGLFLLPLVLDLLAGRTSNAHDILLHLRYQSDAGQTFWQSLLFYGSYFLYVHDPSIFNELGPAAYAIFRDGAPWLGLWLVLGAGAGWILFRPRRGPENVAAASFRSLCFGRRLLVFWLLGSALTLVWGMRQDGGFTIFNSCFNHSLTFALALAGITALDRTVPEFRLRARFGVLAVAASNAAFALALPFVILAGSRGDELAVRVPAILQADPRGAAPKLLTFAAEDWYEAVTLARALQRERVPFSVHPNYSTLFGPDHFFTAARALSAGTVSVWHVLPRERAPAGAHVLNQVAAVTFPDTESIAALPWHLDFGANDHERFWRFGVATAHHGWAWTEGHVAALGVKAPDTAVPLTLTLDASGLQHGRRGQRMDVFVNGELVGSETWTEQRTVSWQIPPEVWNARAPRVIALRLPDAIAPALLGRSGDRRLLALRLHRLTIAP